MAGFASLSLTIKEEEEDRFMDHQNYEIKGGLNNFTAHQSGTGGMNDKEFRICSQEKYQSLETNERLFKCATSKEKFTMKKLCEAHRRTHSELRHYPCNKCKKCFIKIADRKNRE